jgi:hypothetical protein
VAPLPGRRTGAASRVVRPVIEWVAGDSREPFSEPEDGHEVVVVLLRCGEIRNAEADVVDKSGPGHGGTSSFVNGGILRGQKAGASAASASRVVDVWEKCVSGNDCGGNAPS